MVVENLVLGSVHPSRSPVLIPSLMDIFWLAVLTPLPVHAVPGSTPGVPKTSVVTPLSFITSASSPLKEKL